jgi:hypothetical protein
MTCTADMRIAQFAIGVRVFDFGTNETLRS